MVSAMTWSWGILQILTNNKDGKAHNVNDPILSMLKHNAWHIREFKAIFHCVFTVILLLTLIFNLKCIQWHFFNCIHHTASNRRIIVNNELLQKWSHDLLQGILQNMPVEIEENQNYLRTSSLQANKIGKVKSLECTDIPKTFFTAHHVCHCFINVILGQCNNMFQQWGSSHCCTMTPVMQIA
jgi:hypothetical protein